METHPHWSATSQHTAVPGSAGSTSLGSAAPASQSSREQASMRAITYDRYGGPEVLRLSQVERPADAPGHVQIRVAAAGVNPVDCRMRQGEMRLLLPGGFPRVPGYDVSGWVLRADEETGLRPGDRVLAMLDHVYGGGYAEQATCSNDSVVKIPDSLSFEEAAGLPLAGSTALQSLRNHGHLKTGDRVLINGASGGVGSLAVQIAKAFGGRVTGVASGRHRSFVQSLGADEFIDYEQEDFTGFKDRHWDIVFDAAGKSSYTACHSVLAEDGHFVSTEPSVQGLLVSLFTWPLSKSGRVMLARSRGDDLRQLVDLVHRGALRVVIDDLFPLEEAADAHRRLEQGGSIGKLVLRVAME